MLKLLDLIIPQLHFCKLANNIIKVFILYEPECPSWYANINETSKNDIHQIFNDCTRADVKIDALKSLTEISHFEAENLYWWLCKKSKVK
jgi:hypothetical protein